MVFIQSLYEVRGRHPRHVTLCLVLSTGCYAIPHSWTQLSNISQAKPVHCVGHGQHLVQGHHGQAGALHIDQVFTPGVKNIE